MRNERKVSYLGWTIFAVLLFCLIYFILWAAVFKEKMPLHHVMLSIARNYDAYAEQLFVFFPLAFFVFIALVLMKPTPAKRFLRLQASLPTSKIKSLAKGLVEIEGTLIMQEPLISPVNHEECIGYYYTIEDIERDSDGKDSYRTVHRETQCKPFRIQDDTGMLNIKPEGIELILLAETNVSRGHNKRYTETLLKNGQKMLLVGYADAEDGTAFIRKDDHYKILGITSASGITIWNKYQPLLRSFMFTCTAVIIMIIYILLQ